MLKLCTARHHKAPRGTKAYYMPKPYKRRGHRQLADSRELWSGRKDLNLRPLGPDPSRLFGRAQAQIKRIHRCAVAVDTPSFPAARRTLSPRTDANTDSPTTSLGRPSRCPLALARANPAFTRSAIRPARTPRWRRGCASATSPPGSWRRCPHGGTRRPHPWRGVPRAT